jgi:branched-chain amino acid transport system substrate-binding protein
VYWKEGAQILKQAKALGLDVPIIGEDAWYGPVETIAGDATKLLTFANIAFGRKYARHQGMQTFITKFKERHGKDPDAFVATGYDAVKIAAHAIEQGDNNADGIKNALYGTKDYIGALGKVVFDKYGDNVGGEFDLYVLRGGKAIRYQGEK